MSNVYFACHPPLHPVAQGHIPLEAAVRISCLHQVGAVGRWIAELVAQLLERAILRSVPITQRPEVVSTNRQCSPVLGKWLRGAGGLPEASSASGVSTVSTIVK